MVNGLDKKIIIENPGMLTTVQDKGRFGFQRFGMPVAGAMDAFAMQTANVIVGNNRNEAVIEITFPGFALTFSGKGYAGITGADLGASLNGREIKPWQSFEFRTGDRLVFASLKKGSRAYLAIVGGIDVPLVMGSRSTYLRGKIGGFEGRKLLKGDILLCGKTEQYRALGTISLPEEFIPDYGKREVRVVLGPQDDCFTKEEIDKFLSSTYKVTNQNDRMGYRLEGPLIKHSMGPDIISDGIAPGAIQIPGHGQPIIMLADRQTTGGYTKLANVISVDLSLIAQLMYGDSVKFKKVSLEEAQRLYIEQEGCLLKMIKYVEDEFRKI
ncbi:MAG: hypothetical protein JM58_01830 [Peptococcaceae bacterium BICA1-8]|nr:MAG: hypothetical protein JM58_01830 [Peptococcaceae bacterium BICA1-8]